MRVLVTGGAGFIGSHFVRFLLGQTQVSGITVMDSLTYAGNIDNIAECLSDTRVTFEQRDIRDLDDCLKTVQGHQMVVHFAAESHVDRSVEDATVFVQTNVLGTHNLLHAALSCDVSRFLHVSTDEVYGSTHTPSSEDTTLAPSNPYAASKAASDLLALSYSQTHGLDVVVTRCTNNYGTRQHSEKVIPRWVHAVSQGGTVDVHGDGLNVREWIHVEDHVRGVWETLRHGLPGRVYHLAGGTALTNLELAHRVVEILGLSSEVIRLVPDRKNNDRSYALCGDRALREFDFTPRIPFVSGLRSVVEWYRDNAPQAPSH
jgi:dTDP-glucose 4,6-dehydratase